MKSLTIAIRLAIKNLRSNVARTALSLLGIVIGSAAVIVVLSVGAGVKDYVVQQIEAFGSDIIEIEVKVPKVSKTSSQNAGGMVGGTQITTLKLKNAEGVAKISNIGAWYAGIMDQQVASYENENKQTYLMGVTAGVTEADQQTEIESGQMFTDDDDRALKQVAVLGNDLKNSFFGEREAVGETIKIKGQSFKVIGVLKKRGVTGFFNFDNTIYLPIQTLQKKIKGIDYIQFAIFKIKDMNRLDETVAETTDFMRREHKITKPDDDDFAVNSIAEMKDILDKVFLIVNFLLIALTSISLIVGGVGIMNVMYVAVAERTFEIGLRKAVGARGNDVLKQFLFEAIFLTAIGGIIGVIIGALISYLVSWIIFQFGLSLQLAITWQAVAIGFGFSALAGLIFGIYPAKRAADLSPMEALRKE